MVVKKASQAAGQRRATKAVERAKQAAAVKKSATATRRPKVRVTRPLASSDDAEPRILSIDDLMGGRARVALGLASEEEESERARNELFDTVYDDQRKRNWPGL